MQRLVKSFPASDDAGHYYTIEMYQDFMTDPARAECGQVPGMPSFETSNGSRLNRVRRGEYQLRGSGRLLHSYHPDAE
jgi:hypothetical protein